MTERYPQWKIDLFATRNANRCTCRLYVPAVTSPRAADDCPQHGLAASERAFQYERAEGLLPGTDDAA